MILSLLLVVSLFTKEIRPASIQETVVEKCVCPNYTPILGGTNFFCGYEIMSNKSSSQADLACVSNFAYACKEGPNKPGIPKSCTGDNTCMKGSQALVKVRKNVRAYNEPHMRYCVGKETIAKMKALEVSSSA